jgi:hypothetical protein
VHSGATLRGAVEFSEFVIKTRVVAKDSAVCQQYISMPS